MKHLAFVLAFIITLLAPQSAACVAPAEEHVGDVSKLFDPHLKKVHGDTRFSLEERMEIEAAAQEWARFTRGRARFAITWDFDEATFLDAPTPILFRAEQSPETGNFGGKTKDGIVRLVPDYCRQVVTLKACAMHELGHLLGLDHFENINGQVMSTCGSPPARGCGPSGRFGPLDWRECVRVGVCQPHPDITTVTVTVDPNIPPIDPLPPGW